MTPLLHPLSQEALDIADLAAELHDAPDTDPEVREVLFKILNRAGQLAVAIEASLLWPGSP